MRKQFPNMFKLFGNNKLMLLRNHMREREREREVDVVKKSYVRERERERVGILLFFKKCCPKIVFDFTLFGTLSPNWPTLMIPF